MTYKSYFVVMLVKSNTRKAEYYDFQALRKSVVGVSPFCDVLENDEVLLEVE